MCGGSSYGTYKRSPPAKPSWHMFWNRLKMPEDDTGIFVEVVQGCDSVSCKYQCQARNMTKTKMTFDELAMICRFLKSVKRPEIMFYGMGDPGAYDWLGFLKANPRLALPFGRINLSPATGEEVIEALAGKGMSIYFTVSTPEEAVLANMKSRLLGCRLSGAIVPVAKNVEWLEIAKTITLSIEFNSLTPSWSPLYVSAEEFNDGFMSIGIGVKAEEYKLKSGLKPVIEHCFIGKDTFVLGMRRCFQLDSKTLTIEVPKDEGGYSSSLVNTWEHNNPEVFDALEKFARSRTSCDKCSKLAWYYNFRR